MTKKEISQAIAEKTGINKNEVDAVLDALIYMIRKALMQGNNIYIRGLGTFLLKKMAEKKARNISKGETIVVPARYKPDFKPSGSLDEHIKLTITDEIVASPNSNMRTPDIEIAKIYAKD